MTNNFYKPGTWKVVCDRCGFVFRSNELKKTWDGLMVCEQDWEPRHIADFIKSPNTAPPLPFTRPEPADTLISVDYISESIGTQETTIPDVTPGNEGLL